MTHNVRTHTRRTKNGGTTTVRRHQRRGGGPNPSHAWKLGKKARSARKRGRHGVMSALITFAVLELVLWAVFNVAGVLFGVLGAALIGLSVVMVRRRDGSRASGRW